MAAAPDEDALPATPCPPPTAHRRPPAPQRPQSATEPQRPRSATQPQRRPRPSARRRAVLLPLLAALGLATAAAASAQPPAAVVRPSTDAGAPAERPATSGAASRDAAAAPVGPARSPAATSYVWPTGAPADVLRPFDEPSAPWAPGHRGVDLELEVGSAVVAAADGVVVFAGTVVDRPVVSIEHPDGIRTTYEPVSPSVRAGQRVRAGETVGRLDGVHCLVLPPGGCLHLGARTGPATYVDPLRLLRADVVIRLLPDAGDTAG